jgi:threonine/homoserine/homoserine lactone efflux protein
VYLGIQALRTRPANQTLAQYRLLPTTTSVQTFAEAVATSILNPKVAALFLLALLPQFVDPQRVSVFVQFMLLGCLLALLDNVHDTMLTLIAGVLRG